MCTELTGILTVHDIIYSDVANYAGNVLACFKKGMAMIL